MIKSTASVINGASKVLTGKRKRTIKTCDCNYNPKYFITKIECDNNKNIKAKPGRLCTENDFDESEEEEFNLANFSANNSVPYHIKGKKSQDASKDLIPTKKDVESDSIIYSDDSIVVILNNKEKIYCHGLMTVIVLCGTINILGYKLDTLGTAEIYSPRGSPYLFLENSGHSGNVDLMKTLVDLKIKPPLSKIILRNSQKRVAIMLFKRLNKTNIQFIEKCINQPLFPNQNNPQLPQCNFTYKTGGRNVLKISPEWDSLIKKMNNFTKTIICGGKNVGKSTMLRYTINKLLQQYSEILVIDLDPGQAEFTVPGCISACLLRKPIFGPNYTHLRKPDRCVLIPNLDVSNNPKLYIESIQHLIENCEDIPAVPTLINYMGFTQELGFEIFSAAVACIKPNCIIEITSSNSQKNFKTNINYQLICDAAKLLSSSFKTIPSFEIYRISSVADKLEHNLNPGQARELCILSYLGMLLPRDVDSLLDPLITTYAVDMSCITIVCNGKTVPPAVVNGNFVSLCANKNKNTFECLGWGVVRAINVDTNQLYILTPVSQDDLEKTHYIVLGSAMLPPNLYMMTDNCKGLIPFMLNGNLSSLGRTAKRSYFPSNRK